VVNEIINKEKITKLLEEKIHLFGEDKALTILKNQEYNYRRSFENDDVVMVLKTVCSEFNFTYDELVHNNDKSWQRIWALKFCCYYLHNVKSVKAWIISYVLNRSKSLTYRYAKEVEETKDKIVIKFRNNFDKKIK
jgi:hypothetical protein